jgi:hypothetical protein
MNETTSLPTVFRPVLALAAGYLLVSAATEAVLIGQSVAGVRVDGAEWTRCSIVLASALATLLLAIAASRGHRTAFLRVRIISVVVVIGVGVVAAIPGFLPPWVRVEQVVCGLLLLPVAILVNLPRTRALFPKPSRSTRAARA